MMDFCLFFMFRILEKGYFKDNKNCSNGDYDIKDMHIIFNHFLKY